MQELKGKVAVVTGAARGIGFEIAATLARAGCDIAVVDVETEAAEKSVTELSAGGVRARAWTADVSSFDAVGEMGRGILEAFGRVDILVNNAGITRDQLLLRMSPEDWNSVIGVNLTGAFYMCKALAPSMLKQRSGSIVNIASVVGLTGNAGQANYAASKAGMIGMTKSLAKEFAARGVRVNAVAPGFIRTAMTDRLSEDVQAKMKEMIPLGRFGEPRDVASIVMFLVSNLAEYVTGQVVHCDGGMVTAR